MFTNTLDPQTTSEASSMDMDISPSPSNHEMLASVPYFPQSDMCFESMTEDAQQLPISYKDDFTLSAPVASTSGTAGQRVYSGKIIMVVTARQTVTVSADNHSAEHIKAMAFKQLADVGAKVEAMDVVSVDPAHPELVQAMETLELGVHDNLLLKTSAASNVVITGTLQKAKATHRRRLIGLGLLVPPMTLPETTSVLTQSGNAHGAGRDLPLPTLSALPLGSSNTHLKEPQMTLRSRRHGRKSGLAATTVVQNASGARITKSQKISARRLIKLQRDANRRIAEQCARAEFSSYGELDYGQPLVDQAVLGDIRDDAGMTIARSTEPQARPVQSQSRRLIDAEKIRWLRLGSKPSHDKKMEAIEKELRALEA